ncbi:hypothetical protein THAOC_09262 [Thalassiosira oceanica]|uniref:Ribosomal RNA methyltransferase FtsJ domain-containing protein n=1 Tax=Thalassiosira oceanica TaxID=159749 RepID=K0SSY2_THAOC|nr:hypothetical protein THAOC_09262 [Thalassiosira oceanica]|eukprot:EJK69478.1 hypothetical protein THAOC_09262 [Thalassiosira oceanica]
MITEAAAADANVVLHVHRNHLDRVCDLLENYREQYKADDVRADVLSTIRAVEGVRSNSLVFLRASDGKAFVQNVCSRYPYIWRGLNKVYNITSDRAVICPSFRKELGGSDDLECVCNKIMQILHKIRRQTCPKAKGGLLFKVEVFPPKLQRRIVAMVAQRLDEEEVPADELDVTPNSQTHNLTVIRLDRTEGQIVKRSKKIPNSFLVGVAATENTVSPIFSPEPSDDICRAYYKLEEVFERVPALRFLSKGGAAVEKTNGGKPLLAVDSGSAPGGWSKYILEQTVCTKVFSIDPGEMDESVASLPSLEHLKMKADAAIAKLQQILSKENDRIALYVSDMCLVDLDAQVDTFLAAHQAGILREDAAFVLTIKCNVGRSKAHFDSLAAVEARRIKEATEGGREIEIMHLFSNRIGERTIVGFLK